MVVVAGLGESSCFEGLLLAPLPALAVPVRMGLMVAGEGGVGGDVALVGVVPKNSNILEESLPIINVEVWDFGKEDGGSRPVGNKGVSFLFL